MQPYLLSLGEVVEAVDAGGGFLRHAANGVAGLREEAGALLEAHLQHFLELFLFLVLRGGEAFAGLGAGAPDDVHGGVAAIVEDQVAGVALPLKDVIDIFPIFGERFALLGKDRDARLRHRGGGVVLR